ncbi:hypothetical protein SESBI_40534 [Sesbania bispinosa]|nr:hypothetical protein SESBI_40534 [Sesbania bispinosa]
MVLLVRCEDGATARPCWLQKFDCCSNERLREGSILCIVCVRDYERDAVRTKKSTEGDQRRRGLTGEGRYANRVGASRGTNPLGSYATIKLDNDTKAPEIDGIRPEAWKVSYTIEGSKRCLLNLTRYYGNQGDWVRLSFHDSLPSTRYIIFFIRRSRAENNLVELERSDFSIGLDYTKFLTNETNNYPWGGVTKTMAFHYGSGSSGDLLVIEQKTKNGYRNPYMVTVTHYYAFGSRNIDIGLSMVLNTWVSEDNKFEYMLEGPVLHPSSALFFMFQDLSTRTRSRTWTPIACPHCYNNIPRQPNGQSEGEESDSSISRLRGSRQNAMSRRSLLANDGDIRGNGKGNIIFFLEGRS